MSPATGASEVGNDRVGERPGSGTTEDVIGAAFCLLGIAVSMYVRRG